MGGDHGKEALSTEKKKKKEDPWLPEADEDQDRKKGLEEEKTKGKKTLSGLKNLWVNIA